MSYDYLIFDLDGTISDPKDGIVRSLNYALSHHGFPSQDENELSTYIGPPLDSTFKILSNSNDEQLITALVAKYRERYADVGYSENVLYDGIPEVLTQLAATPNTKLGLCTSKRVDFAEQILKMFGLRDLFSFVSGGEIGIEKWQQLGALKEQGVVSGTAVMIGDRKFDLVAGSRNGFDSAGVLWGYGSKEEVAACEAEFVFEAPVELLGLVKD